MRGQTLWGMRGRSAPETKAAQGGGGASPRVRDREFRQVRKSIVNRDIRPTRLLFQLLADQTEEGGHIGVVHYRERQYAKIAHTYARVFGLESNTAVGSLATPTIQLATHMSGATGEPADCSTRSRPTNGDPRPRAFPPFPSPRASGADSRYKGRKAT